MIRDIILVTTKQSREDPIAKFLRRVLGHATLLTTLQGEHLTVVLY